MVVAGALTTSAVDLIAAGVFAKSDPLVVEAYSEPDRKPLGFSTATELATYINTHIAEPRGLAFVFVVYPDMRGRPIRKTIHLDPKHCPGEKFRYTWDGWGLISIQLYGADRSRMSRIAANSAARARAWASTYPEWNSPEEWNWKAVESHTRRLQRILKKVT
jgi:hypothetical protein